MIPPDKPQDIEIHLFGSFFGRNKNFFTPGGLPDWRNNKNRVRPFYRTDPVFRVVPGISIPL